MTDFNPFDPENPITPGSEVDPVPRIPDAPDIEAAFVEDDHLPEPLLGEMTEEDRAAFEEAATLSTEVMPPPRGDEPLLDHVDALVANAKPVRTPEPTLENARKDANASVFLEAWGEEVFLTSAYYRLWQAEWRHQCMRDEIIERQGERKTKR